MSTITWTIDHPHAEIQFSAKHMLVSNVRGHFDRFDATVTTEGDTMEDAKIHFSAETASVNTGTEQRDNHLRSDDFFNAEKYPKLSFESTSFKKVDDHNYKLTGNLTIRDVTNPIELNVEYGGEVKDSYGNRRKGFAVTGKLRRKEFGLKYNALLEAGGAVVSDEIKIDCHAEFIHHD